MEEGLPLDSVVDRAVGLKAAEQSEVERFCGVWLQPFPRKSGDGALDASLEYYRLIRITLAAAKPGLKPPAHGDGTARRQAPDPTWIGRRVDERRPYREKRGFP